MLERGSADGSVSIPGIGISGDRGVQLIGPRDACALVARVFPAHVANETPLLSRDRPNYCVVFEAPGAVADSRHSTASS